MDVLAAVGTIAGLIGGVAKITATINDIKSRWQYAGLSITMLSSSLWAIRAALEEIVEWRSESKDKSQKSEQLDTNLEVCIQGCAVLVAFMENRLKEFDLEDLSKYDKFQIVSIDNLFKTFANDIGAQVRALQLLLTIYQCRTLTEQNERLQRRDTKNVVRAARRSTASLMYEDKDIEDAASILSETPSRSFDFDRIIMQHQSYSRTYPRLYAQMQQNFPSRRGSVASTIKENLPWSRPRQAEPPMVIRAPDLPFLGVPFVGETVLIEEHELEDQEEGSYKTEIPEVPKMIATVPKDTITGFPIIDTMHLPTSEELSTVTHYTRVTSQKELGANTDSGILSKSELEDKITSVNKEAIVSADTPSTQIPRSDSHKKLDHKPANEESQISLVHRRRTSSFDSLYDDSDTESIHDHSRSSPQAEPVPVDQKDIEDVDAEKANKTHQTPTSSRPGSVKIDPSTSPKKALSEDASHLTSKTAPSRLSFTETQQSSDHDMPQEAAIISPGERLVSMAEQDTASVSETASLKTDGTDTIRPGTSKSSAQWLDSSIGDEQQDKFLSGLLNFSFNHDIDLPLTPRGIQIEKPEHILPQEASREEDINEAAVDPDVTPPNISFVLDSSAQDTIVTENQVEDSNDKPESSSESTDKSNGDQPNTDLSTPAIANSSQTNNEERIPLDRTTSLPDRAPNDRQSFINYYHYTHQNDPFHRPYPAERKDEVTILSTPARPPPPVPALPIPFTPNEASVIEEGLLPVDRSFEDGIMPLQTRIGSSSDKILHQDGRSSFQSERSTNMQTPASPASIHGASSVTSVESSYISRDSMSTQTQGTTVTATLPNTARIISDPIAHEKRGLAITKAFGQYGQKPQPLTHRLSNLASYLNPKTASERNAKAQQLAFAIRAGNATRVLSIIQSFDKPSDISTLVSVEGDIHAISALMRAAKLRDTDCMDILLKHDPQTAICVDNLGQTALHHALTFSASDAVLWLITRLNEADEVRPKGKDSYKSIDIRDKNGIAPVHLAARLNDVSVIEAMQKAGADLRARDVQGGTVLQYAIAACSSSIVQYLIKQKLIDINSKNARGETALMIAASVNDELSAKTLLENGADKNIRDNNGDMAIHRAARCGNLSILELLFLSIEDVKAKNSIGEQPIHLAAAGNHVNIISALLKLPGVQINTWTEPPHLRQPVKRAEGLAATMKLASTALHYACSAGHYQAADILLTHGASANGNQEDGFSPLMMACQAQNAPIAMLLLLNGADPKGSTATDGMTALHIACRVNDVACTNMLLERGANPLARLTKSLDTPTSLASRLNPPNQRDAAAVCVRYQREVLRATYQNNGIPSLTTNTITPPPLRHAPNIRPMMSGPALISSQTVYQPRTAYFAATEEQPPPPYQA